MVNVTISDLDAKMTTLERARKKKRTTIQILVDRHSCQVLFFSGTVVINAGSLANFSSV